MLPSTLRAREAGLAHSHVASPIRSEGEQHYLNGLTSEKRTDAIKRVIPDPFLERPALPVGGTNPEKEPGFTLTITCHFWKHYSAVSLKNISVLCHGFVQCCLVLIEANRIPPREVRENSCTPVTATRSCDRNGKLRGQRRSQ